MHFNKATFVRDPMGKPRSVTTAAYKKLICPVEKALYGRTPMEWVKIFEENGGIYVPNDEFRVKRWYASTLNFLKKQAFRLGTLWLPEGEMRINIFFYPHKKVLDLEITSSYIE